MAADTTSSELVRFHEHLAKEIREDLSGIVAFETESGFDPYFQHYYRNWLGDEKRLQRTMHGAIARRRYLPAFVERLKKDFGEHPRVVDVGCGFASDALLLAWLGCEVVGVDPDARKIAVSAHRAEQWRSFLGKDAPEPRFLVGRLQDLTYLNPASFDGGFASESLHHCEPVEDTLLTLRTIVQDTGRVFVLESNGGCPANEMLLRRLRSKDQRRTVCKHDGHYELYGNENIRNARTWKRLFRDCAFDTASTQYTRHLLSELTGGRGISDETLCRLPGASFATIHVTFELVPRPVG